MKLWSDLFLCVPQVEHQSGITLWPLTGEVNNTDYLFIMAPVSGWDIVGNKWMFVRRFVSEEGKMGQLKHLSKFDKGQFDD